MGLFDGVGLWTNVEKTVGMVYQPCRTVGSQSEEAYTHRVTGEGPTYKAKQRERVLVCGLRGRSGDGVPDNTISVTSRTRKGTIVG